jgi:hypothetical protein
MRVVVELTNGRIVRFDNANIVPPRPNRTKFRITRGGKTQVIIDAISVFDWKKEQD